MGLVEERQVKRDTPSIFSRSFICNWHYLKFISTPHPSTLTGPNDRQGCFPRACPSLGPCHSTEIRNFPTSQSTRNGQKSRKGIKHTLTHTLYKSLLCLWQCENSCLCPFLQHTETHNSCLHVYTHSCTGHFRGPHISGANAHTRTHTHSHMQGTLEAPRSVVHLRQWRRLETRTRRAYGATYVSYDATNASITLL